MMTLPDDMATWLYFYGFLIKGFGAGLFLWWIGKARGEGAEISTMFVYMTILLLGSAARDIVETYGGWCRSTLNFNMEQMAEHVYDTWFWPLRMVIPNAIFTVLVGHMAYRAFWQRKHGDKD